jgi:histidyl-tRNA synthetase
LKKQFGYADKNNIPYVLMAGPEEITSATYGFKNMRTGEQLQLPMDAIIAQSRAIPYRPDFRDRDEPLKN